MILKPAADLFPPTATLATLGEAFPDRFNEACEARSYLAVILDMGERCMLQATFDAMQARTADVLAHRYDGIDPIPDAGEPDGLRNSLIVIQAKAMRRLRADLMHTPKHTLLGRHEALTCDEAVELVESGIPALGIDLGHLSPGAALHVMRRDVAQALSDVHLLLFSLDVEEVARLRCSPVDDHELTPATRASAKAEEDRVFAECYPDFGRIRRELCEKLEDLEARLDEWLRENGRPRLR